MALFAFLYYLGVFEAVLFSFSPMIDSNLYDNIEKFNSGSDRLIGFQPTFVIYSLFWYYFAASLLRFSYVRNAPSCEYALKVFASLLFVYFIFGFTSFSNRWGFFAWLFIPIVQSVFASNIKGGYGKLVALFFPLSLMYFILRIL